MCTFSFTLKKSDLLKCARCLSLWRNHFYWKCACFCVAFIKAFLTLQSAFTMVCTCKIYKCDDQQRNCEGWWVYLSGQAHRRSQWGGGGGWWEAQQVWSVRSDLQPTLQAQATCPVAFWGASVPMPRVYSILHSGLPPSCPHAASCWGKTTQVHRLGESVRVCVCEREREREGERERETERDQREWTNKMFIDEGNRVNTCIKHYSFWI